MSRNPIKQETRKIKYDYLRAQGSKGGTPYGFIVHAEAWLKTHQEWVAEHTKELFLQVCQKTWGEKLSKASPDQIDLVLDGDPLPRELKYHHDATGQAPSEPQDEDTDYVTVLTDFASLRQFRLAWMELQNNANDQVRSASLMLAQYQIMFKRARGDESRRVMDLLSSATHPEPA